MSGHIPHTVAPNWPERREDRFASSFSLDSPDGCAIALLGLPDDTGVRLNRGRLGAAGGPRAFRAALAAFGVGYDAHEQRDIGVRVFDAGDVDVVLPPRPHIGLDDSPAPAAEVDLESQRDDLEERLRETHRRVTEAVGAIHSMGMLPVCIGGGHDLTFASVRALAQHAGAPVGGINVDPHLDVREQPGSGMGYRALIEGGHVDAERLVQYSTGRYVNTRAHHEWLSAKGAAIISVDKALEHTAALNVAFDRISRGATEPAFVSFDLDAIDGAQAPGVSAVCPMGLNVGHALRIAERAGRHPSVRHFDIMELCPPNDEPPSAGRTARVAAMLFLSFVSAYSERASS
ncbi:MAG: hypothetical protein EA379_00230 [Phycisphaerales bacterium]|nr:MAG: hypothetical protein EA379_00230 [Phycisphaerales bacterium]